MALTQLKTGAIADDAVTTDKLANAINTARDANTAKSTNATHTGEVTGSGALTITADAVTGAKIADDAVGAEHIEVLDSHLQLTDNSNIKLGTGDDLLIYHNGTDSYVKNSTGDLYIRDTNGNVYIQPKTDENGVKCIADGATELYHDNVKRIATNSSSYKGAIIHGDATNTSVAMQTESTARGYFYANNSDQIGLLDAGGDWAIKHANDAYTEFRVGTAVKATVNTHGLTFNGDTAAANALDDYEEGTFTPDWRGASALGTTSYGTYNAGSYVKIGNLVTVTGFSEISSTSGGSGTWFINNMPFTVGGGDDRRYRAMATVMIENFDLASDVIDIVGFMERNNNDMSLRTSRDNGGSGDINTGNDTSFEICWTITYRTV